MSLEIKRQLESGEITPQQAMEAFISKHKEAKPNPLKPKSIAFPTAQVMDRQSLAQYRPDLAQNLANLDMRHYHQRMIVEEFARNSVALPAYAIIGVIDGIIDSTGFLVSEVVEDVAFGVTRTIFRFKDGIVRGKL